MGKFSVEALIPIEKDGLSHEYIEADLSIKKVIAMD
jgi:hypothetical protein